MNRKPSPVILVVLLSVLGAASTALAVPPPASTPLSPSGAIVNPTPTYTWTLSPGATMYSVQTFMWNASTGTWDQRYLYARMAASGLCSTSCSFNPGVALVAGSYKWQVGALNSSGVTWSSQRAFQVNAPAAPTPQSPSGGTLNPTPAYTWTASLGATRYSLRTYVFDAGTGTWNQRYLYQNMAASGLCSSTCSFNPGVTLAIGSYRWQVAAGNDSGGNWSGLLNFQVNGPPAPAPQAPTGWITTSRPTYQWQASSGATAYQLEVIDQNATPPQRVYFNTNIPGSACSSGTCVHTPTASLNVTDYTWHVRGTHAGGAGPWSPEVAFHVAAASWPGVGCGGQTTSGDFNGDGHTDRLCAMWGVAYVSLSSSTGLAPGTPWLLDYWPHQIMATDLNGDGKADLVDYDMNTGGFTAALALPSGAFAAPVSWGVATAQGLTCRIGTAVVGTGDFDGDGKTDVYCRRSDQDPRYVFVGRNTGSSFSFSLFGSLTCDTGQERVGAVDLDGDGLTDWYCINHLGQFFAQLSNGTSFVPNSFTTLTASYCDPSFYLFTDLNGDGAPDVVCPLNGNVALSTGHSLINQGSAGGFCAMVTNVFAADIDADGVAEIVCNQDAGNRDIMVRRWSGTQLLPPVLYASHFCDNDVLGGGDFDGDGRTDLICGIDKVGITGTTGIVPDLMASAGNGLGGTTSVQYTPSSAFPTTNNPGVQPLVTAIIADDGRGGSSTSTYSYSGAKADPLEGFLGFASIAKTLPCLPGESTCPTVTTYYSQVLPSRGRPTLVQKGDGSNFVLQESRYFYQTQAGPNPPRVALLQEARTTDYGPTGGSKTTSVTYTYDTYGNPTQVLSHGLVNPDETETGNDELVTNLTYRAPDTTKYLVDRVALREQVDVSGGGGGTGLTSVQYGYNGVGDLTSVTTLVRAPGRADHTVTRTMGYDGTGNLASIVTELGGQTLLGYDSDNLHVQTVTNPAMEMTTTIWDPRCGQPTSVTDPNNQATHTSYDALCRPLRTDLPNGGFVQTSYALTGNPQTQHVHVETAGSGANQYSESYFDGFGRTCQSRRSGPSSADIVLDTTYNGRGSVSSTSEPYYDGDEAGETTFSYDRFDRLLVTTHPDNRATTKSYGLWSETTTDAGGKSVTTTRSTRSAAQTKTIGGQQVTTTSTFDLLGRLTGLQETAGQGINNLWTWSYDSLGRKTGQNDPDAGAWTWSYDDTTRTTTQTDAIGQSTVSTLDNMGRLLRKTSLSGVTTLGYGEPRGSYNNIGRLTSVSSPGTSLQLDYDTLGNVARQTRAIDAATFVMNTDYDLAGRVAALTYYDQANGTCSVPGTCTIGPFTYDGGGRIAGVQGIVDDVTYDAAGRPLVQSNSNGTVTTKAYWPHRGLLNTLVTTTPAQTGPVQNLTYSDYDDVGNLRQMTDTMAGESWQFGYDDGYRMTSASSGAGDVRNYTYDPIGRITYNSAADTYAYPLPGQPRPHAPTSVSGLGSFTYDANGNLLAGNGRALGWNAENLPMQVTSGGATTSFTYDGIGDRVKKLSAAGTSYYPFGDDYEVTNGVVTAYVSVPGLGVVAKRVGTGTSIRTFWLHTDRLGSINAITTDGSQYPAGTPVLRRTYAPYGETLSTVGTHAESRGWIDQRKDTETGLTYLHARYFDPKLGTFLSPDPIGVEGGMNQYGYGFGDPVNGTDRSGLLKDQCEEGDTNCRKYSEEITITAYVSSLPLFLNAVWYNPPIPNPQPTTSDPAGGGAGGGGGSSTGGGAAGGTSGGGGSDGGGGGTPGRGGANPVAFAYGVLNRADYYFNTATRGSTCSGELVACRARATITAVTLHLECEIAVHHPYGWVGGALFCAGAVGGPEVAVDPDRICQDRYQRCLESAVE